MSNNSYKIEKSSKKLSVFLLLIVGIIAILSLIDIYKIVCSVFEDSSNFFVNNIKDGEAGGIYVLGFNSKEIYNLHLSQPPEVTSIGVYNLKASYIINVIVGLLYKVVLITIILIVYNMLKNVVLNKSAFIKSNVKSLRIISILMLVLIFIPNYLYLILNMIIFLNSSITFDKSDILLVFVSLIVYSVSYVMDYGVELQKEVDEMI